MTSHELAKLLLDGPDLPVMTTERLPYETVTVPAHLTKPGGTGQEWGSWEGVDHVLITPERLSTAWDGHWEIRKIS